MRTRSEIPFTLYDLGIAYTGTGTMVNQEGAQAEYYVLEQRPTTEQLEALREHYPSVTTAKIGRTYAPEIEHVALVFPRAFRPRKTPRNPAS